MSLGFLTFLNVLFFLAFGLEFENYWSDEATESIEKERAEYLLRVGLAIGLPLAGAIFTVSQTLALRNFGIRYLYWILAGPIGFMVPMAIIFPITSIWGDIPGPVEPLTIVGGGLIGTAAVQWIAVRKGRKGGFKWLLLWSIGLVLGMIVYVSTAWFSESVWKTYATSWATEVGVIGFLTGSMAAATSGRMLYRLLSQKHS